MRAVPDGSIWRRHSNGHTYLVWVGDVTNATTGEAMVLYSRTDGVYTHYVMGVSAFVEQFEQVDQ